MKILKNKGFKIIELTEKKYKFLSKISFAKQRVKIGEYTDTHKHRFFSAYLVKNMEALKTDMGKIKMPKYGLVIVYPKYNHTWINSNGYTNDCYVSDLSPAHGEHFVYEFHA